MVSLFEPDEDLENEENENKESGDDVATAVKDPVKADVNSVPPAKPTSIRKPRTKQTESENSEDSEVTESISNTEKILNSPPMAINTSINYSPKVTDESPEKAVLVKEVVNPVPQVETVKIKESDKAESHSIENTIGVEPTKEELNKLSSEIAETAIAYPGRNLVPITNTELDPHYLAKTPLHPDGCAVSSAEAVKTGGITDNGLEITTKADLAKTLTELIRLLNKVPNPSDEVSATAKRNALTNARSYSMIAINTIKDWRNSNSLL